MQMRCAFILLVSSFGFTCYASVPFWKASAEKMEAQEEMCDLQGKVELETEGFHFHAEKMHYDTCKQLIEAQTKIRVESKEGGILQADQGILFLEEAKGRLSGSRGVFYKDSFEQMPIFVSARSCLFFWDKTPVVDTILFLQKVEIDFPRYARIFGETALAKREGGAMRFFSLSGDPFSLCRLSKGEEANFLAKSIVYDAFLHKVSCYGVAGSVASLSFDPLRHGPISLFSSHLVWEDKKNILRFPEGGNFSIPGWGKIESKGPCKARLREAGKRKEIEELCAKGKTYICDESLSEEKFRSLLFGGSARLNFVKGTLVVDSGGVDEDKVVYNDQNLLASANCLQVHYTPKENGYKPTSLVLKGAVHIAVAKRNRQLFSVFADSVEYNLINGKLHITAEEGGTILCIDPSSSYQIRAEKMTLLRTKKGFEIGKVEGDMRMRLSAAELELMRQRVQQLQTLF